MKKKPNTGNNEDAARGDAVNNEFKIVDADVFPDAPEGSEIQKSRKAEDQDQG
jgi:hypothetical protein